MFESVVEILQKLDPLGLSARDLLRFAEVLEVFVVGADADRVLSTKEEWAATFETKDDAKEFLIMSVIIGFCREETVRVESNGMKPILVFLGDDYPESVAGGVGVEDKC
jgi:hypothetical protein